MEVECSDIEITIIESQKTHFLSAEVGAQIKHLETNIIVKSTLHTSQHKLKLLHLNY